MATSDEISKVYKEALSLIDKRDTVYADRWKSEPLQYHWNNAFRKIEGLRHQLENGTFDIEKGKEDLLDGMNYLAFVYRRLSARST